jgi:N6-adenosine-specific RNA methylase IME4
MLDQFNGGKFRTILADPPWQFQNRTGKMAPEHRRLSRYGTMDLDAILAMPVAEISANPAHLYLWVPNALLPEGLRVMEAWGFSYKSNIVWHKIRKDGGPDGRGVGFYFRNTTELVLFGVRGKNARTKAPGRRQVNIIKTQKREHSRKPDELYDIIEACSEGPFLELFARGPRAGWSVWGDQAEDYAPSWATYANHSASDREAGVHYSANAVVPVAAQAGKAALSLVNSEVARKLTIRNCLEPEAFIETTVKPAPGRSLTASEARDAYRRRCEEAGKKPVADLAFWRSLSATASKLGAEKLTKDGRVSYCGVALAA